MDPRIRSGVDAPPFEDPAFAPPAGKKAWYRKAEMPFIWLGAGLVLVLVLFLLFFPGKNADPVPTGGQQVQAAELSAITERLDRLAASVEALRMQRIFTSPEEEGQPEVLEAVRKLNADISLQMAALSRKIDGLQLTGTQQIKSSASLTQEKGRGPSSENTVSVGVRPETSPGTVKMRKVTVPDEEKKGKGSYTVQKGDTLFSIAKKNGVSLQTLLEANRMRQNDPIHPGQKLEIPR